MGGWEKTSGSAPAAGWWRAAPTNCRQQHEEKTLGAPALGSTNQRSSFIREEPARVVRSRGKNSPSCFVEGVLRRLVTRPRHATDMATIIDALGQLDGVDAPAERGRRRGTLAEAQVAACEHERLRVFVAFRPEARTRQPRSTCSTRCDTRCNAHCSSRCNDDRSSSTVWRLGTVVYGAPSPLARLSG